MTLTIGLTGGIGSGKSTVARILADLGAHIVDTDAIAHRLTAQLGSGIAPILAEFGTDMISSDGAMDRARMRALVFSDPSARRRLEAILHPLIRHETQAQAALAPAGAPVVFDVPLLVESGQWRERVERVLVIDCSESTQIARVMARNGWTQDAVQAVIAQQASRTARCAIADAVVLNDGIDMAELSRQVRHIWHAWTAPHATTPT